jgi:hypothetical protein
VILKRSRNQFLEVNIPLKKFKNYETLGYHADYYYTHPGSKMGRIRLILAEKLSF